MSKISKENKFKKPIRLYIFNFLDITFFIPPKRNLDEKERTQYRQVEANYGTLFQ